MQTQNKQTSIFSGYLFIIIQFYIKKKTFLFLSSLFIFFSSLKWLTMMDESISKVTTMTKVDIYNKKMNRISVFLLNSDYITCRYAFEQKNEEIRAKCLVNLIPSMRKKQRNIKLEVSKRPLTSLCADYIFWPIIHAMTPHT